jgi:hypothetical protein
LFSKHQRCASPNAHFTSPNLRHMEFEITTWQACEFSVSETFGD